MNTGRTGRRWPGTSLTCWVQRLLHLAINRTAALSGSLLLGLSSRLLMAYGVIAALIGAALLPCPTGDWRPHVAP
jgi:hypothetical protein